MMGLRILNAHKQTHIVLVLKTVLLLVLGVLGVLVMSALTPLV
jgi:hypothetical protein